MKNSNQTNIQAKVFDFALVELVLSHRDSFQPIWTVDSWVKFLIWMALNCGCSGDQKSLELFSEALGKPLTYRMRRLFFERDLEKLSLRLMADPAESQVLIMPSTGVGSVAYEDVDKALDQVNLSARVVLDQTFWQTLDAVVAIPWQAAESES